MGSGISTLPEYLTEEEVKRITRERFNQTQFNSFKEENGTISKANFTTLMLNAQDNYVNELFLKFTGESGQMDSRTFVKLAKDAKLINSKTFTPGDADIIFHKAKARYGSATKTISYEVFKEMVVYEIATKLGVSVNDVMLELSKCDGPVLTGTHADDVRLHNAPARRASDGPRTIEKKNSNLILKMPTNPDLNTELLLALFMSFCPSGEMDSRTFMKMMIDCKILDKNFTNADCDLVFQKVKFAVSNTNAGSYSATAQGKKITFDHFVHIALLYVAEKKSMSLQALVDEMCLCPGPTLMATNPDAVRFHDDKSTYPLSSQKSGDASAPVQRQKSVEVGKQKSMDLNRQKSVERSPDKPIGRSPSKAEAESIQKLGSMERSPSRRGSGRLNRGTSIPELALSDVPSSVEYLFSQYCPSGEMDSKTFMKMMKDCDLLDSKFTTGDVDLIFQKAKTREAGGTNVQGKKVSYRTFVAVAIPGIADKKGVTVEDLVALLVHAEGPKMNNVTEVEAVRFHDDKTTYTGVHASS